MNIKTYNQEYYKNNNEKIKARRETQREHRLEYQRNYVYSNPERMLFNSRECYKRTRIAALDILGKECIKCGFSDPRALQIDHINGDGATDRKTITKLFYKVVIESILKGENKYQLLCANCNWIKRVENKEYKK